MTTGAIPFDGLPERKAAGRAVSSHVMLSELQEMLARHLYTGLSVDDLLALDEPDLDIVKKMKARNQKLTQYDMRPRYELRYSKGMRFSESGTMGRQTDLQFRSMVEYMFRLEHQAIAGPLGEQPDGDWRLVGAVIRQVDLKRRVPVMGGQVDDLHSAIRKTNADNPGIIRQSGEIGGYTDEPDVVWMVPMVFADIAQAELQDPARLHGTKAGAESALTAYIETRQLRSMSAGMRLGRKRCEDLLREYELRQDTNAADLLQRQAVQLSQAQVKAALEARLAGNPPALIASMMGIPIEVLEMALAQVETRKDG